MATNPHFESQYILISQLGQQLKLVEGNLTWEPWDDISNPRLTESGIVYGLVSFVNGHTPDGDATEGYAGWEYNIANGTMKVDPRHSLWALNNRGDRVIGPSDMAALRSWSYSMVPLNGRAKRLGLSPQAPLPSDSNDVRFFINDKGTVSGSSGIECYRWTPNEYVAQVLHSASTPASRCTVIGMNNAGLILFSRSVGGANSPETTFIFGPNGQTPLVPLITNAQGWTFNSFEGINDRGEIIGNGTLNGRQLAFILHPVVNGCVVGGGSPEIGGLLSLVPDPSPPAQSAAISAPVAGNP
ncbi:MAG: hypothetical protein EBZ48_17875 [Proteobacteria bacterium]|nr:hypothetical protein [Pseudomonadota bacterium]